MIDKKGYVSVRIKRNLILTMTTLLALAATNPTHA